MPDPPAWAPDAEAVAAILRARTVDDVGAELGEFTENTRPTAATVAELIAQAVGDVEDRVGTDLPAQFHEAARSCAALRAAQLVEMSYQPQSDEPASAYTSARLTYEESVTRLERNVQWDMLASRGADAGA